MKHLVACFIVALLAILCPYLFEWDYMKASADDYIGNSVDYANPDEVFAALCEYYSVDTDDYYYYYCPSYLTGSSEGLAWCMIARSKTNPYFAQSLDVYAYNSSNDQITYYMQGDLGCYFRQGENFTAMFGTQNPSWGGRSNVQDSNFGSGKLDLPVQVYSNVNSIEGYRNTTSCPDDMTFKLFGSSTSEYSDVKQTTGLMLSYFSQFGFNPTRAELVNGSSTLDIPIVNEGDSIGFEGYFLKVIRENFAYRFIVGYVGSNRPIIYQDWQCRVYFDSVPECQNFKVAGITVDSLDTSASKLSPEVYFTYGSNYGGNEALEFNGYYGLGTLQTIPYNAQNGLSITFNWFSSTFTQVYDCIFTVIDYDKLVGTTIDPETGETVNQYSNVSTSNDYSTHVQTTVNNSIVGMTGIDSGAGSFSADWSGTSPDGNFTYDDNFTFNDGGLKSFFSRIWTVGDGFFATALLGVLSIAFAAYLLYGKR